jgi:hypothetical protein
MNSFEWTYDRERLILQTTWLSHGEQHPTSACHFIVWRRSDNKGLNHGTIDETKVKGYKLDGQRLLIRTSLIKDKHNCTSLIVDIFIAAHFDVKYCPQLPFRRSQAKNPVEGKRMWTTGVAQKLLRTRRMLQHILPTNATGLVQDPKAAAEAVNAIALKFA